MSKTVCFLGKFYVAAATFPISEADAEQAVKQEIYRKQNHIRVFPCDSKQNAQELAEILA